MSDVVIRQAVEGNEGTWFWDCAVCPCAFGVLSSRAVAESGATDHQKQHARLSVAVREGEAE